MSSGLGTSGEVGVDEERCDESKVLRGWKKGWSERGGAGSEERGKEVESLDICFLTVN